MNCTCVKAHSGEYWIIDHRIYDPDDDGKSRLHHVRDMLVNVVHHKALPVRRVLMDTRYATKDLILFKESPGETRYCPLRSNWLIEDSADQPPYRHVDSLQWDAAALYHGETIKIKNKGFPKHHKVKPFRVEMSTHRTDSVVTNDITQESSPATQDACGPRSKIDISPSVTKPGFPCPVGRVNQREK
ncbi:hypothetical protein P3T23_005384 [Paraburkholderia sp. GAS448]